MKHFGDDVHHVSLPRELPMRTIDVRTLVREVLDSMPKPYSHHVIDEVFAEIERQPGWRSRYEALCSSLGRDVVNNWGGRWVALTLEKVGEQQVSSKKSTLIGSYSILDTDAKAALRKPNKAEAIQLMSDYYKCHRAELPRDVRDRRDLIIELILEGIPAEEAFAEAKKSVS
ncbi:hypothetical protein [Arenimonas metalli]|uniref:hypothetical protein n=1 Tax=Arenimonas metalli TaxID=948077 RepID=UPI0012EB919B|nr:hypothetical protein [Arenimonas metalli]